MQYIKLGRLKIPFKITGRGSVRTLEVAGIKLSYSTYEKDHKKYYKFGWFKFRVPNSEKVIMDRNHSHYLLKDQLTQEKIEELASGVFKEKLGYSLNLEDPKTMNEKIFWLKMYYRNPLITKCCDKFCVKEYVEEKLGPGYVIPTIASWERAEDVDFSVLPDRYVLKVNWSSGYNIIVKDSSKVDGEEFRKKIRYWMKPEQNSYYQAFNWGYKNMKPVVYAEEYMEQLEGQLYDYKFFCCDGKVRFMLIATDRFKDGKGQLTHDFFDRDFNNLPFTYGGILHAKPLPEKPHNYDRMIELAEKLAQPFPFVRVDFYEIEGKLYVGEMTFYPGGGTLTFDPPEWDKKLGDFIRLPEKTDI